MRVARSDRTSLASFNMRDFIKAAGQPKYDAWERHEAWRYQGPYTKWNRFKGALPGLGIASIAFTGYCVFEKLFEGNHECGHEKP